MEESSGVERLGVDEISLLAEELIQLSVKSSMVVPSEKPTLLCTIWTRKSYNPDSFRSQMKSIWKTRKKFEIQLAGQNLFLIVFETEEDLETIMEGRPWLFRKQLILFDRLEEGSVMEHIERLNRIDSMLEDKSKSIKKTSWKRIRPVVMMNQDEEESVMRKRKSTEIETDEQCMINSREERSKMTKRENKDVHKREITVNLRSFSKSHIDVLIKEDNVAKEWRFTGFYGSPYVSNKNVSWNLLRKLGQDQNYYWLVSGDFNKIMYSFENSGGIPREERRMETFREVLEEF
ncbi:hypothetical protein Gogos_005028 [Gossypium gossypioides]|uniref:DUF4283 domain-containing protein n=1 Tax=Gossypium gossypioides TaxID=34282 RepID=A0A7J9CIA7_GOSGO|nr:hypothetical protein [Gossypium gossypioides]